MHREKVRKIRRIARAAEDQNNLDIAHKIYKSLRRLLFDRD